MNEAEFSNKKYAPFINKEIFQDYRNLENLNKDIFTMFKFWVYDDVGAKFNYKGQTYTKKECQKYIEDKQKEIAALSDKILDDIREYLQHLDVIKQYQHDYLLLPCRSGSIHQPYTGGNICPRKKHKSLPYGRKCKRTYQMNTC